LDVIYYITVLPREQTESRDKASPYCTYRTLNNVKMHDFTQFYRSKGQKKRTYHSFWNQKETKAKIRSWHCHECLFQKGLSKHYNLIKHLKSFKLKGFNSLDLNENTSHNLGAHSLWLELQLSKK